MAVELSSDEKVALGNKYGPERDALVLYRGPTRLDRVVIPRNTLVLVSSAGGTSLLGRF